jgi:chemotaxis protein methyltransferase CheR
MTNAFARIRAALIERTGHHYYADKDRLLRARLQERQEALGLDGLDAYEARLGSDRGEAEWRALEDAITIGETYFFRHPDHFARLRSEILPRLIESRRADRSLRIWSIGCSTGAEPYSIAVVLRDLLGANFEDWRVSITGGDISERALAAAREARYGQWALRTLGPAERSLYFDKIDARTWRLKAAYRAMVRFERQNVLELLSPTPPLAWNGFDLIFCRNVLIYFSPAMALALTKALRERLAPDGAMVLGHAEAILLPEQLAPLGVMIESEFGQAMQPLEPNLYDPIAALALLPPSPIDGAAPQRASTDAPRAIAQDEVETLCDLADSGDYQRASELCQNLIARDPTSATLRYYEAMLAQVSDDLQGAEIALRRALYLDRNFILAHYRLGLLLLGRRQDADARRALATAIKLASRLPDDADIPHGQGVTAASFSAAVRLALEEAA